MKGIRHQPSRLVRLASVFGLLAAGTIGFASLASAAGGSSLFEVTVSKPCIEPGDSQTITVAGGPVWVMNLAVSYPDGTKQTLQPVRSGGNLVVTWTVAANAPAGQATFLITALLGPPGTDVPSGVATASGLFAIGVPGQPCVAPSNAGPIRGIYVGRPAAQLSVKKACDPGVTGAATFSVTLLVPQLSAVLSLPDTMNLNVGCNSTAVALPLLSTEVVVTLHEVTLPAGAAPADDTLVIVNSTDGPVTITIHNAGVAPTAGVTPTASVTPTAVATAAALPRTGGGTPALPGAGLLAFALGTLVLTVGGILAGTRHRRRGNRA